MAYVWPDWGKPIKNLGRNWAETWSQDLPNTKQERQSSLLFTFRARKMHWIRHLQNIRVKLSSFNLQPDSPAVFSRLRYVTVRKRSLGIQGIREGSYMHYLVTEGTHVLSRCVIWPAPGSPDKALVIEQLRISEWKCQTNTVNPAQLWNHWCDQLHGTESFLWSWLSLIPGLLWNRRFVIMFTRPYPETLQSSYPLPLRSILIISSHLCLGLSKRSLPFIFYD
jgi:hypothetical protein